VTWFRVDDGFHDHPKVVALQSMPNGGHALALWLLAGTWSSRHLQDGNVPSAQVTRLGFTAADAESLVAVGLWTTAENGYAYHEWDRHQPSRDDVLEKRKREADRKRLLRLSARSPSGTTARSPSVCPRGVPASVRAESQRLSASPDPTRPDPTQTDGEPAPAPQGHARSMATHGLAKKPAEKPACAPASAAKTENPAHPSGDESAARKSAHVGEVDLTWRLRSAYESRYLAARGGPPGWPLKSLEHLRALSAWASQVDWSVAERALNGFFADSWASSKGFPIGALASDPMRYASPPVDKPVDKSEPKPAYHTEWKPPRARARPVEPVALANAAESVLKALRNGGGT
jgi:hypothetical protein